MQEPSIDTDKLSYEIFSILESKFLFGYDDQKHLWVPKHVGDQSSVLPEPHVSGLSAIKNQRGKICILSIDGGGGSEMRGILPGKALAYLEESLKKKSGNPQARIADFFDVAAGTGFGGIFTAMLFSTKEHGRPIFKADETWRLMVDHGKRFFYPEGTKKVGFFKKMFRSGLIGPTDSGSGLERVVKEMFSDKGRSLTLRDTLKPVLIPCYDLSSGAPLLFSRADALETDGYDFRLWEVCRATSAEPGLVEPVLMRSVDGRTECLAVDGGLAMSNPTAAAITHVLHNKQEFPFVRGVEDLLVLSLGTGQLLEVSYGYQQVKEWKTKNWVRPMARIAGDGSADSVDQAVAMAFGQSKSSSNYVRIQECSPVGPAIEFELMGDTYDIVLYQRQILGANGCTSVGRCGPNVDKNASPENVKKLVEIAEEMLKQKNVESVLFGGKRIGEQSNAEKLDWFAGELVVEHQRRSCRIAPTVAFKQAIPNKPS